MELQGELSRSGAPTCRLGGRYLHSSYDPIQEAARFLDRSLGDRKPACALLGGPCLGFHVPLLRARIPGIKIVAVQYDRDFRSFGSLAVDACWYPGDPTSLERFLDTSIDEEALAGLVFLEWPAAAEAYPEEAARCREAAEASLARLSATGATIRASGKVWIRNACRSFLLAESLLHAEAGEGPALVLAAGPSLDPALDLIARVRSSPFLLATSSALSACAARGIMPDLVVATDGGFWSRHHLYPLRSLSLPLAVPLAALPSSSLSERLSILLLDQGQFPESELAPLLGPSLSLPSQGTVSATAKAPRDRMEANLKAVAGLDLASHGIRSHARPHGFDPVGLEEEGRLRPREGRLLMQESEAAPHALPEIPWRSSRALEAYAGGLRNQFLAMDREIFRILPSPVALPAAAIRDDEALGRLLGDSRASRKPRFSPVPAPALARRRDLLSARIAAWRRSATAAIAVMASSGHCERHDGEMLRAIDLPAWAGLRRSVARGSGQEAAADALSSRVGAFLDDLETRFFP